MERPILSGPCLPDHPEVQLPLFRLQLWLVPLLDFSGCLDPCLANARPPVFPLRAFFWLVSLLMASVVWFILVHVTDQSDARLQYGLLIFGAAVSVLLQEMFRFAYYKLLK